jgi:hypothetical protein
MTQDFFFRIGRIITLIALFLLPWQTRYIFWHPSVGTSESEFGVISIYATMMLGVLAAVLVMGKGMTRILAGTMLLVGCTIFFTYPSVLDAWILNVFFASCLGYATYHVAKQDVHTPLLVLTGGLGASFALGLWQMIAGFSPASTILGLASRNAQTLGDAVLMLGDERILRMYGSFPHPNVFGVAIAIVFGVAAIMMARQEARSSALWKRWIPAYRTGRPAFTGMTVIITLFCISRSAALAMGCASLAILGCMYFGMYNSTYQSTYKHKLFFGILLFIPVVVWLLQFFTPTLLSIRGTSPLEMQSISERVTQVADWWQVMDLHGFSGVGLYNYPTALTEIHQAQQPAWAYQPVHNVFMLVLAELGVWGVGCGVLVVGIYFFCKQSQDAINQDVYIPILITLWSLAWFDHALWTSWAGMAYTAVAFGLLMGSSQHLALSPLECLTPPEDSVKSLS